MYSFLRNSSCFLPLSPYLYSIANGIVVSILVYILALEGVLFVPVFGAAGLDGAVRSGGYDGDFWWRCSEGVHLQ